MADFAVEPLHTKTSPPIDLMNTPPISDKLKPYRQDLIHGVMLAVLTMLIWCANYNRWTSESWHTPLTYNADPLKGDVLSIFAAVKVASEGHFFPILFRNIPELGAPYIANWNDLPLPEILQFTITGMLASLVGIFAAVNLAVMVAHVLAAVSFFTACRMFKSSWVLSFAGALIFAFSRYAFAHGAHHFSITFYWHIPLYLVVCRWLVEEEGIDFRGWKFRFALGVAVITAIQNPYYTNLFLQFVFFGGLIQWWRRRDWRASLPSVVLIATVIVFAVVMSSSTFIYHIVNGPNSGGLVRPYKWMEIYALKTVDLIIPPPDHPFPPFAAWGARHLEEVILSPGELPPSAYIGLLGLAALCWLAFDAARRALDRQPLPYEAFQILWVLLYSDVGGLNGLAGTLGFQLFRATTRYSIFILCVVLMYAIRRLSATKFSKAPVVYAVGIPAVLFALWDQMPPKVTAKDLQEIAEQVDSDRNFTEKMEQALPQGAMVFQLPIMEYPESPAPGVGSSDHFRPFLYSNHLRYAFGSDKGRPRENWQQEFTGMQLNEIVGRLESYGYAAIYVNRNGFPDKGEALEKAFKHIGRGEMIESEQGDLFCVFLKPSSLPILPDGGLYH